ncbi:Longitudinals lacking protein-like [Armadillidium nasatum]|uniref:Longitudinals lacking protein-like n=1 Tax=Armadillidium nasatum TaxID=96803 RepID=A0A5N5SJ88_9CRUS|nr:Longitudinals lacking protein-like [Armadillidium nasatum]
MNVASTDILSLQWLEHQNIFSQAIFELRNKSSFTDATLACEGKFYPVHKFVLSTCSEYFNAIFEWTPCVNPVVVINNISTHHLESLLSFMYRGETSVQECHIQDVMKAAECLHIKGLSLRPEDLNFAKNKIKNTDLEEPKKKRRKSENVKKTFLKPQVQSDCFYGNQVASPIHSAISSSRPTPTPPPTPIHHSSPHHTPQVHSPLHAASPHALSSTPSPVSQNQFQNASPQMASPKPHVMSSAHFSNNNNNNNNNINLNQQARNIIHLKDALPTNQMQNMPLQHQQQIESYITTQPRSQFPVVKDGQTNLVYSSLPNAISSSIAQSDLIPTSHESQLYRKFSSNMTSKLQQSISHENVPGVLPLLPQMPVEQKIMSIGEELNLGPVKEIEMSTEAEGTVGLPEMLEDLVGMRSMYDAKVETYNEEAKPSPLDKFSHGQTMESSANVAHYEQEKRVKVYSNNGTSMRKRDSSDTIDITQNIFSSKSSSSNSSTAMSGPSPSNPSVEEKKEATGSFVCDTCNRVYKKRDSLTRHMRTHSEYPYLCTVCHHKCKLYKDYIQHRKTHANKRCDQCDFVTIRTDALRRHKATHSEDKSHKCPYIDCAFTTFKADLLASHVQSHHYNNSENNTATSFLSNALAVPTTPTSSASVSGVSSTAMASSDPSINPEVSTVTLPPSSSMVACSATPPSSISTIAVTTIQSEYPVQNFNNE